MAIEQLSTKSANLGLHRMLVVIGGAFDLKVFINIRLSDKDVCIS